MKREQLGENQGRDTELDDMPMSSVVYMGRGSFRMEAVALDPAYARELEQELGVVQPIENTRGTVTEPLHTPPPERRPQERGPSGERRGHDPRALFSSQVDVPVLAAPTGAVGLHTPAVTLTRAMLVTLCGLVLLCGVVVGTAARHLLASPAPLAVVSAPPVATLPVVAAVAPVAALPVVAAVAPVGAPSVVTAPVTVPSALKSVPPVAAPLPAPVVSLPVPVAIHAHAKVVTAPVARKVAPKTQAKTPDEPTAAKAPAKPWVDPWAE